MEPSPFNLSSSPLPLGMNPLLMLFRGGNLNALPPRIRLSEGRLTMAIAVDEVCARNLLETERDILLFGDRGILRCVVQHHDNCVLIGYGPEYRVQHSGTIADVGMQDNSVEASLSS